jgi:hypothetical protein
VNQQFLEQGTHGSKIGKHWFEPLRTCSSSNWEPVLPIWFQCSGTAIQDWEALIRTFGNQQFFALGDRAPMTSIPWKLYLCKTFFQSLVYAAYFLVFDVGMVRTYHFFEPTHFFNI